MFAAYCGSRSYRKKGVGKAVLVLIVKVYGNLEVQLLSFLIFK
jgi:hypothetical protein